MQRMRSIRSFSSRRYDSSRSAGPPGAGGGPPKAARGLRRGEWLAGPRGRPEATGEAHELPAHGGVVAPRPLPQPLVRLVTRERVAQLRREELGGPPPLPPPPPPPVLL